MTAVAPTSQNWLTSVARNKSQLRASAKRMAKANAAAQREAYKERAKYRTRRAGPGLSEHEPTPILRTGRLCRTRQKRAYARSATAAMQKARDAA